MVTIFFGHEVEFVGSNDVDSGQEKSQSGEPSSKLHFDIRTQRVSQNGVINQEV